MSPVVDRTAEGGLGRLRRLLLEGGGLMASLVAGGDLRGERGRAQLFEPRAARRRGPARER